MGYTTDFTGQIELDRPLTNEQRMYLRDFSRTRRVKRDAKLAEQREDTLRIAVGLPIGVDGGYFVGDTDNFGQNGGPDVLDGNSPPSGQPGLWCQWVPNKEGDAIEWDGGEKFYDYVEWLEYIIDNFLKPWGYVANGEIDWVGEDSSNDMGTIWVKDNQVEAVATELFNPGPSWDRKVQS